MLDRRVRPNVSRRPSGRPASIGSTIDVRLPNSEYALPVSAWRFTASQSCWYASWYAGSRWSL